MIAARCVVAAVLVSVSISTASAAETPPGDVKIVDSAITGPLTDAPAEVTAGRKYFANRKLGNCLACHANSEMSEQLFHGEVGPSLDGVASRYSREELRAILSEREPAYQRCAHRIDTSGKDPDQVVAEVFALSCAADAAP